jgi:hypothetical protein
MTKKKIKETRLKLGYEEPADIKPVKTPRKSNKSKKGSQVGLFSKNPINREDIDKMKSLFSNEYYNKYGNDGFPGHEIDEDLRKRFKWDEHYAGDIIDILLEEEFLHEPSLGVYKLNNPPVEPKKTRKTSRKKRSNLDRIHKPASKKSRKKKVKSPVSDAHVTEFFKILAAEYGEKYWMKIDYYRGLGRSKLERMLSASQEDFELADDDHDFTNHRYGEVDGRRVRFVSLDEMTVILEDLSTLTSIGLL